MKKLLAQLPLLVLVFCTVLSLALAAHTAAQPAENETETETETEDTQTETNPDTNTESENTDPEGLEVGDGQREEFYYWDVRKDENDNDETVIIGAGGLYDEEVVFKKDPQDVGSDLFTYTTSVEEDEEVEEINGWLPIRTEELEYDAGEPKSCAMDTKIPLVKEKGKYKNDFTLNVSRYAGSMYVDLIGDSTDSGSDSFIFSWFAAIGNKHGDEGAHLASVPYHIATKAFTWDNLKEQVKAQLDVTNVTATLNARATQIKANMTPYVTENNHEAMDDDGNWTFDYHKCEFSFKDNFNTTLSRYDPRAMDNSTISGKLLGREGMKFKEWIRRTDNIREYLAIERSAIEVTRDHCNENNNVNKNLCQTILSKDVHKCYARAIGYTIGSNHLRFEDIPNYDGRDRRDFDWYRAEWFTERDGKRIVVEQGQEIWMHSIRVNTDAFVSCFSYGMGAGDLINVDLEGPSNSFFTTNKAAKEFAQRIVDNTIWPASIWPLLEEPQEASMGRGDKETTCSLGKLGWIMCPTIELLSTIADSLFKFLEGWMKLPPLYGSSDQAAFAAWVILRDFGNILFSILFLAIIVIQATGGTLSGFTIRKKVPHIIITAVLINASFVITSIAVDASNIIGASIISTLRTFSTPSVEVDGFSNWEAITASIAFAGSAAAGTIAVIGMLAALIPMLITTVFSMVIVLVLLLLRQALVIILVVIAPIAISARLLPGTEQWFRRWKSLFTQMIMLYPAIALVFGGAYFASTIIVSSASEQGGFQGALLAIFGLSLQVLPLFITPIVLKLGGSTLNSAGGMIRSKMSGAQKASTKAANAAVDRYNDYADIRAAQGGRMGGLRRRRMRQNSKTQSRKDAIRRSQSKATAGTKIGRFVTGAAGGGISGSNRDRIQAALAGEADKLKSEDLQISRLRAENDKALFNADSTDQANAINMQIIHDRNTSPEDRMARMGMVVNSQDIEFLDKLITEELANMTAEERQELAKLIKSSGVGSGAAHYDHPEAIEAIENGTATVRDLHQKAYARGDYTQQSKVARQSGQTVNSMKNHLTTEQIGKFQDTFERAAENKELSQHMNDRLKQQVREMR